MSRQAIIHRTIRFLSLMLSLTLLAAIITYLINPDMSHVLNTASNVTPSSVSHAKGWSLVGAYFLHNGVQIPLVMLVLSLIPIGYLYLWNPILTAILPGILYGIVLRHSVRSGLAILIGSLPHSLLEYTEMCVLAAFLFEINRIIRLKWHHWRKRTETTQPLMPVWRPLFKGYLMAVVPLCLAAAICETFVADVIANWINS